ncbi:hypothetical protein GCM10010232_39890 [Streptomyces amakusaensis]
MCADLAACDDEGAVGAFTPTLALLGTLKTVRAPRWPPPGGRAGRRRGRRSDPGRPEVTRAAAALAANA